MISKSLITALLLAVICNNSYSANNVNVNDNQQLIQISEDNWQTVRNDVARLISPTILLMGTKY